MTRVRALVLAVVLLAMVAACSGDNVSAYAFARTGYHRGLDQLRRAGWKGHGPVPWAHEPNQGFLRALIGGEWIQLSEATSGYVGYVQVRADFGLRF